MVLLLFVSLSSVLDDTEDQPRSFKVFDCLLFKILAISEFMLDMHFLDNDVSYNLMVPRSLSVPLHQLFVVFITKFTLAILFVTFSNI